MCEPCFKREARRKCAEIGAHELRGIKWINEGSIAELDCECGTSGFAEIRDGKLYPVGMSVLPAHLLWAEDTIRHLAKRKLETALCPK